MFWGLKFSILGFFLVSISLTWGFFAYSKQFEVVILMLLIKQKMLLGVPNVVWVLLETLGIFFFGGGVDFCPHSRNGVTIYTVTYISGTHGVNATPLWAGTEILIPRQCGHPLRIETERSHIT